MPIARFIILAVYLLTSVLALQARVIRVPQDAPTIQVGLDSMHAGDTLFLSLGTYEEILFAPPIPFTMLGEIDPDSSQPIIPVIDGSRIEGHDTTTVLTIPELAAPSIENIRFRNLNRDAIRIWADTLYMRNCIIDSAYHGIYQRVSNLSARIVLEDCVFDKNGLKCVRIQVGNFLYAYRCAFSGSDRDSRSLVIAGSSEIDNCSFKSDATRSLLNVGHSATVTNCVFGPVTGRPFETLVSLGGDRVRFSGNTVIDCAYGNHAVRVSSVYPDSIEVQNNVFENCRGINVGLMAAGALGLLLWPDDNATRGPLISGNVFVNNAGFVQCDDISPSIQLPTLIEDNCFIRDSINGLPSIGGSGSPWQSTPLTLRNNIFEECGYALDGSAETDAQLNWWGHASGPYHETENPQGLGDTITGPVQFIPWLTDTITSVHESRNELPADVRLEAYPNPFNSTTLLSFTLVQSQNVRLVVFDILGRAVKTLTDKYVSAGTHEIRFDVESLAGGLYFARLETVRNSITKKLVLVK